MKPEGLHKVCPLCGSTDLVYDASGGGLCNACSVRSAKFTELRWIDIPSYKRSLVENKRMRKLSFYHCDELYALMILLLAALALVFFIFLVS